MTRFMAAARLPIARDLAVLYAITFGGFVAFGVYLPHVPQDRLRPGDHRRGHQGGRVRGPGHPGPPRRRLAGRPDHRRPGPQVALGVVAAGAVVAVQPRSISATVAFLTMAAALGLGNGAVFALVGTWSRPASAASPAWSAPAASAGSSRSSPAWSTRPPATTIGLMLLSDVALAGLVFTAWRLGGGAEARAARRSG